MELSRLALLLCLVLPGYVLSWSLDWTPYPLGSQQCLDYYARQTSCDTTSPYTFNYCLCNNYYNWVNNVANCVHENDPDNIQVVYGTLKAACASTATPISFSREDWLNAAGEDVTGGGGTTTSESTTSFITSTTSNAPQGVSSTPTPTTSPTSPNNNNGGGGGGGGLSVSDKIAIGIGVPVGIFTIIGAVLTWCMCCRG